MLKTSRVNVAVAAMLASTTLLAASFKTADTDKDGTIDRKEAAAMPFVLNNFDSIDQDKDGTVDAVEIAVFRALAADKDHDGTLEIKEVKDAKLKKVFATIDADKDGTIDAKELASFYAAK